MVNFSWKNLYFAALALGQLVVCTNSWAAQGELYLQVKENGQDDTYVVMLSNKGGDPEQIWGSAYLSGMAGGGRLVLVAIGPNGQLMPACAFVSAPPNKNFDVVRVLQPGEETVLWHGSQDIFRKIYCLEYGAYNAVLVYVGPHGELITSNSFSMSFPVSHP